MRIFIANDQHWPMKSGVATAVRTLATGLSNLGHEVMVLAPSQNGKSYDEVDGKYTIHRIRSVPFPFRSNLRIAAMYKKEIRNIIKSFNPDIIHVHTQLTVGLMTLRVSRELGIPFVATNHLMPENVTKNVKMLKPIKRPVTHIINEYILSLYRGAKRIVLPTKSVIPLFNTERVKAPIVAISNGIDLSLYSTRKPKPYIYDTFNIPKGKHVITWLGRLDAEKHLEVAIKAFIKLSKTHEDIHLLMVGAGNDENNLLNMVYKHDIVDRVTFTGLVSDEDKYELHRVTDIFVVTSPNELQCLSMLESMACGKPVVAVDAGALGELVENNKNGYLVETDNVGQFVSGIEELLADDEKRQSFGKESRKISCKHDIKSVIPKFLSLYEESIEESR